MRGSILLCHQPTRTGRCRACPRSSWRRSPFPCVAWMTVHGELQELFSGNPSLRGRRWWMKLGLAARWRLLGGLVGSVGQRGEPVNVLLTCAVWRHGHSSLITV